MDGRLLEAPCGFISMDHNCCIVEVNDTFLEWMDYARQDLLGVHIEVLMKPVNKMIFHSYFYPNIHLYGYVEELFIHLKNRGDIEIPYLLNAKQCKQGSIDCILVQMKKRISYELELRSAKQQLQEAYIEREKAFAELQQIYREIEQKQNELIEMNEKLVVLSNTDMLTSIPNRRFFENMLEHYIQLYKKERQVFSLLLIDIDYFKEVNDTYGHQTGDIVLVQLANMLKNYMAQQGVLARFGGEEFAMILSRMDEEQAMNIAKQLNRKVEQAIWQVVGSLTVSIEW